MIKGNALIAQGGGPTSVINQSLVGTVLELRKIPTVGVVIGAMNGIRGIIEERLVDLSQETSTNLELVANTPSSALGSTRDKPDEHYCDKIVSMLQKYNVRAFFYIGGNDSAATAHIINNKCIADGYNINCMHIPKTIDNDIVLNDHCPGFPSAARYVSNIFSSINLDVDALPAIYIGVIMGRNSGFLTASAAIAKKYQTDGPHLIYLPERVFDEEVFISEVRNIYDKYGKCIIAVSEGIKDIKGNLIVERANSANITKDQHNNIEIAATGSSLSIYLGQILKNALPPSYTKRLRSETLGTAQRCYVESISDVDQREAREVGEKAVHYANNKGVSGSIIIKRDGFYSALYGIAPLEDVAGKTMYMPDHFIDDKNRGVTSDFLMYVRPLLGSGMPSSFKLRMEKNFDI